MPRIRLLLVDFDGTLVDTRRANALAYVATLREAGHTLTEEEYLARYFGMRCDEFLARLGIADPAERERLRLRKIALYPAFFDTVRLNLPLWEFCRSFRAQGGRVWIVSTGSRANIDNVMRHLGLAGPPTAGRENVVYRENVADSENIASRESVADPTNIAGRENVAGCPPEAAARTCPDGSDMPPSCDSSRACAPKPYETTAALCLPDDRSLSFSAVDGILSGADVARSKPFPDCFLEAMRREGCTPAETLIFEDSPIGLEAACRSGAAYIRVVL